MDLVSSTLDKYLKHRFNGDIKSIQSNNIEQHSTPSSLSDTQTSNKTPSSMAVHSSNDSDTRQSIEIHKIAFRKLMPCCVALRDDCQYLAAGFENSHIYLWHLVVNSSSGFINSQLDDTPSPTSPSNGESRLKTNSGNRHRLLAHSGSVYSIKFLNDNDLMLSCSEDTTIRLWCLKTKCNLNIYRGHSYPIWTIAIATLGDYFASGSMDSTARLWRLDQNFPLRLFCGHDSDVECVEFHPNAKYVATGSTDCTLRLWSIADGRTVRLMVGHKKPILSLSFLPDGKFLASASSDGSIKIWNLATNGVTNDLFVPESSFSPSQVSISFSPEQSFVSTCGCDNILRVWHIGASDFTKLREIDFTQQFSKIVQTHFSRNNKLFVMGYEEGPNDIGAQATQGDATTTTTTTKATKSTDDR